MSKLQELFPNEDIKLEPFESFTESKVPEKYREIQNIVDASNGKITLNGPKIKSVGAGFLPPAGGSQE